MLTVAYCRVSTEEQAAEGWSIEGQAEKLKAYAKLRDLGPVTVVEDPGWSGKNMKRPGLTRLLKAIDDGLVAHVLIWRLDRLSRDLADLILMADRFLRSGVSLHSFTEQLDYSSASGRMQFHVLGTFAQFFREQLAENVDMGIQQAIDSGRWTNRPKTGYSMVDGLLVPNHDAPLVRKIFRLRSEGKSFRDIEVDTGIKYSTARAIVLSRIYLGEVQRKGKWSPGLHQALVTVEEWESAQRAHLPGRRRSKDVLAGRVRCGMCGHSAGVQTNQDGKLLYRCWNRGQGCAQPRRSAAGLARAAVLGLGLLGTDAELRSAIRAQLAEPGTAARQREDRAGAASKRTLAQLSRDRKKLLDLFYADSISADLFAQEEKRITASIEALREETLDLSSLEPQDDLSERFEQIAAILGDLDIDGLWTAATDAERRVLVEEMIESIAFFPDHLEIKVSGAPRLNVLPSEVGLKQYQTVGVEGGT